MGRILVFTGARQTGKTTLVKQFFHNYAYLAIDDPVESRAYLSLTASQWKELYPRAVLDEVQKKPVLIESIKSVYDRYKEPRYVLLGSSQLLLLEKVRESLAGRCTIVELFPLTLPERCTNKWKDMVQPSFFQQYMKGKRKVADVLPPLYLPKIMREQ
jgi:predicted AAA+ superfamily ATPase